MYKDYQLKSGQMDQTYKIVKTFFGKKKNQM